MIDRVCISLGEKCCLKCHYCHFRDRLIGAPECFTIAELTSILDSLHRYCIDEDLKHMTIGIVGAGEPLFEFAKIKAMIDYCKTAGYDQLGFYTITNGILINEEILNFFYVNRSMINVCFSLDGYKELHNAGRERFDEVFDAIIKYESIFGKKPAVNCTVHKETILNADATRDFFKNQGFTEVTFSRLVDMTDKKFVISRDDFDAFVKGCQGFPFAVRQLRVDMVKKYDCTMYGKLCGVGKNNVFITKDGIYPCGRFYGNATYRYASFGADLHEVEEQFHRMKPLIDGECYFDKYMKGRK